MGKRFGELKPGDTIYCFTNYCGKIRQDVCKVEQIEEFTYSGHLTGFRFVISQTESTDANFELGRVYIFVAIRSEMNRTIIFRYGSDWATCMYTDESFTKLNFIVRSAKCVNSHLRGTYFDKKTWETI